MQFLKTMARLQKGFSLVEITITMGVLGIAAVAAMNLTENVSQSTKRADALMNKTQLLSSLEQYLYSQQGCMDNFNGMTFSTVSIDPTTPGGSQAPTGSMEGSPLNLSNWKYEKSFASEPDAKYKDVVIEFVRARVNVHDSLPKVQVAGAEYLKTSVQVQAKIKVRPMAGRDYIYTFNVPVLAKSSGKIDHCSESKLVTENCAALGLKPEAGTGRCIPDTVCLVKGTYQLLRCVPSTYGCSDIEGVTRINTLSGGAYCPIGSVAHLTGNKVWTHTAECGKKCTVSVTDTMEWFTCLTCPP